MDKQIAQKQREIFSHNLQAYMDAANISQSDIVTDLDITASTVSDWVNAKKYPRVDRMQQLADYLGVTLKDLREAHIDQNIDPTGAIKPTGWIPIYGVIPAGVPALAEECIEGYQPTMLRNPDEYFYLRVNGDSMIGAGIQTGSLVLIHIQSTAENGDIVACRVNGDEATLKRFKQTDDKIFLLPENADYDPIVVSPKDFSEGCAQIMGVAKQVVMSL